MDRRYYSKEAAIQARRERAAGAVVMLVFGMAVGAVIALLFAPVEGEEMRDNLGDTANNYYENGRESTTSAFGRLQREFTKLRDDVENRLKDLT